MSLRACARNDIGAVYHCYSILSWIGTKRRGESFSSVRRNNLMSTRTQMRDLRLGRFAVRVVFLSLLFGGVVGCAPAGTQPVDPTTAPPVVEETLPSGWV